MSEDYSDVKMTLKVDGVAYTRAGWLGCQLESSEWLRKPAGASRTLKFPNGKTWFIYLRTTERQGLKVRHTWGIHIPNSTSHTEEHELVARFIKDMRDQF